MQRRQLLESAAGTSLLGTPLLSGCVGQEGDSNNDAPTLDKSTFEWCVSGNIEIDAVVGDTVIGRRDITEFRHERREVLAINASTGAIEWNYKTEESTNHFIRNTVADGIYLIRSGPQDPNGIVALELDGTKRWSITNPVGIYPPVVANDTVYVATNHAQAYDAASGDRLWDYELQDEILSSTLVTVTDTVVVATDSTVYGLDPTEGTVQWEYDSGLKDIHATSEDDGTTYVVTGQHIAAVSDGAEQWRTGFDTPVGFDSTILGTTADRVVVFLSVDDRNGHQLQAFDVATGKRSWAVEPIQRAEESPKATIAGETAYLGGEILRAVDVTTGGDRWEASVGDGQINTLTVIDNGAGAGHTVFAQAGETQLATFTPDGEETWARSINVAPDRVSAKGKYVFTGTTNEICAFNRQADS